jgi:hypothetical protein
LPEHLKQLQLAWQVYADDNNGRLVPSAPILQDQNNDPAIREIPF